jgi:hypothetical protein
MFVCSEVAEAADQGRHARSSSSMQQFLLLANQLERRITMPPRLAFNNVRDLKPSSFVVVLMHHRVGGDVHVFRKQTASYTHHEAIAMRMQPLETLKTPFMVTECCLAVSSVSGVKHHALAASKHPS